VQRVKRAAISLKPKQPYVDWANALEPGGVKMGTEYTPEETIYLITDEPDELLLPRAAFYLVRNLIERSVDSVKRCTIQVVFQKQRPFSPLV